MISTAEGIENNEKVSQEWNLSIYQNNDIYLYIDKDEEHNNGKF